MKENIILITEVWKPCLEYKEEVKEDQTTREMTEKMAI